jgi:teichuronic acid biosynthesis glycosyltransferase TuaC
MAPSPGAPQRGSFVRDQVSALRTGGVDVDLLEFAPGRGSYPRATRRLRSLIRSERFDVVHAHYGLTGWCASLAGARPLVVTFHGTDVRHPTVGRLSRRLARRIDLVAAASRSLFSPADGRPGLPRPPGAAVLPCGPDLTRFAPRPRAEARARLGLDPDRGYLLFPADPGRAAKRHDRAAGLARRAGAELLVANGVEPEAMPDWVNAANAVLVTSDTEGFGLAVLEALGCGVPVLSTPVGMAPLALGGLEGCLVANFDEAIWADAVKPHLEATDPRVEGAPIAARFSAARMAERVTAAYRDLVDPLVDPPATSHLLDNPS